MNNIKQQNTTIIIKLSSGKIIETTNNTKRNFSRSRSRSRDKSRNKRSRSRSRDRSRNKRSRSRSRSRDKNNNNTMISEKSITTINTLKLPPGMKIKNSQVQQVQEIKEIKKIKEIKPIEKKEYIDKKIQTINQVNPQIYFSSPAIHYTPKKITLQEWSKILNTTLHVNISADMVEVDNDIKDSLINDFYDYKYDASYFQQKLDCQTLQLIKYINELNTKTKSLRDITSTVSSISNLNNLQLEELVKNIIKVKSHQEAYKYLIKHIGK